MAKYTPEMRERALRMLAEARGDHPNPTAAARRVAGLLGMSPETPRLWQRRAQVDSGERPGVTTEARCDTVAARLACGLACDRSVVDALLRPARTP